MTENSADALFCSNCGSRLNASGSQVPKTRRAAERRQLTILFCDLVGSTALSANMDPEEFRQIILDYHQVAENSIRQFGGHVAQYLGDGLLAYFGYPEGLEDAPRAGIRAGLGILESVKTANRKWADAGRDPVEVRIAIHTGLAVVDEHLALGGSVNIASRLEGLAPHNGLVISPETRRLVQGWFKIQSLGKQVLKGITEPMEVFQVIEESGAKSPIEIAKSKGLSPLVGRQNELNRLTDFWNEARNQKGKLVLIEGEAGIGKSRLVDSLINHVSKETNHKILEVLGSAYHQYSSFHPLIEVMRRDILEFDDQEDQGQKITRIEEFLLRNDMDFIQGMPLLLEFLSLRSDQYLPLAMSPIAKRQLTLITVVEAFLCQSVRHPLLLVVEDLHWIDASTLEWLSLLIKGLQGKSVLALTTTRPGFKAGWDSINHLKLNRLAEDSITSICNHQSGGKALPEIILNQIAVKTEGVPLFVEELTKTILESDILEEKDHSFEVTGDLDGLSIPTTLQDSLLARLDRLADAKIIVQVSSVLGREFSFDMLHAVVPGKIDDLEQSLSLLLDAEIFYKEGLNAHSIYRFKHALIQETAYNSQLLKHRQQLHLKVANVMEHQFKEITETQPELLAHHYTKGSRPVKALPKWLQAGQQASQKHANSEAIAHLKNGLKLLNHIESKAMRDNMELDLRLILGGAYVVHYGYPHPMVGEEFNRAREITQTVELNSKLAFVLMNLIPYYFNIEDYQDADSVMSQAMELSQNKEHGYLFMVATIAGWNSQILRGNLSLARNGLENIIEKYDPAITIPLELTPGGDMKITAIAWLIVCLQISGFQNRAREMADEMMALTDSYRDSRTLYHIYTFHALHSLEARQWKIAADIMDHYIPIARDFGDPIFVLTAEVYYNIARGFQENRSAFEKAVELVNACQEIGFRAFAVCMAVWIGELYLKVGELEPALNWIDKYLEHVKKTGTNIHTAELFRVRGKILKVMGKPDAEVEQHFTRALEISRDQQAKTFELRAACDLASLWHCQGKTKEGYKVLKDTFDWFPPDTDSVDYGHAQAQLKELNCL